MRRSFATGISIVASTALVASLLAFPMSAAASTSISNDVGADTNWEVPDSYMTNTVEKDGTLYKVITTWANAWALSGPDYLGVSNSGTMSQNGGSAAATELANAQTSTLLGIWASAVNEVPNAYNWNYFYNLALDAEGEDSDSTLAATNVGNSASPGFDTQSGVWTPFRYRPEVIWCSNSLSASETSTYVSLIQNLTYYTSDSDDAEAIEGSDNEYYVDGDESYDPYVVDPSISGKPPLTENIYVLVDSLYELVDAVEQVEEDTADYNSDGSVTESNVTWKTMNNLPRTTRYEVSSENAVTAREAALDVEKLMKGSVYYTLAKIADGTTEKKTVAFVVGTPDTENSSCTVISYTGAEINRGSTNGKVGFSALTVDALTTGDVVATDDTYVTYTATVDDLLTCDYIWVGDGSLTVSQVETWLAAYATTETSQAALSSVEIITDTPALMNGHNVTFEKSIANVFNICTFYPELWPDLELVSYWYDNIYHIKQDSLSICMQYGLGNATMPSGVELSDLPADTYSADDIDAKALEGYEYYVSAVDTDTDLASVSGLAPSSTYEEWAESELALDAAYDEGYADGLAAGEEGVDTQSYYDAGYAAGLADGASSTDTDSYYDAGYAAGVADGAASVDTEAIASSSYDEGYAAGLAAATAASSTTKAANTLTVKGSTQTVKYSKLKKAKQTIKGAITVKKAKGSVTYTKASGNSKISIAKKTGKITVKKGLAKGTYKLKVKVKAAGNSSYKAKTKTVTVKIKVK